MKHQFLPSKSILFLCYLLLQAILNPVRAQTYPLWGGLQGGPYAVGFKSTWKLDYTRSYNMVFDDSTRYATRKAPRPILFGVWYPTQRQDGNQTMHYDEYLNIISSGAQLEQFSIRFVEYSRKVMIDELFGKPENELSERQRMAWKHLLQTPTATFRDATPASGKFPLIIFRSGGQSSYEDNSVLCEYLASNGYVVVGSAFQYADGTSFGTESGEDSMPDMAFLIDQARQMPNVDWQKIGVGGHSSGAQAALRFKARPQSVADVLFLLDTTQDYHILSNPLWDFVQPVLENNQYFTGPMLIIAGSAAIFQLMDRLDQADRYYFTIDEVGHNEFISQGVARKQIYSQHGLTEVDPDGEEISQEEMNRLYDDIARRYRVICEYILVFLDARLKEKTDAISRLADLYRSTMPGPEPHAEHLPVGATMPDAYALRSSAPPTPRQLRRFYDENGLDPTLVLLRKFWTEDAKHAIYDQTFGFVWVLELSQEGETEAAQALFRQYAKYLEGGLRGEFFRYCSILQLVGEESMAEDCFENLLSVDPGNSKAQEKLIELRKSSN